MKSFDKEYKVVNKNGEEVKLPATLPDFRGDLDTVIGISRASSPGSAGRVNTTRGEFFPGVFNLTIVKRTEIELKPGERILPTGEIETLPARLQFIVDYFVDYDNSEGIDDSSDLGSGYRELLELLKDVKK